MTEDLFSRKVNACGLSVPTALAVESLFYGKLAPYDPEREIPQHVDVNNYSDIYINLSTLFRNLVSSVPSDVAQNASIADYKSALETEIDVINSLFQIEGNAVCRPRYYFCNYTSLLRKKNVGVLFREDKTHAQKKYREKHDKVLDTLKKASDEYLELDSSIRPAQKSSALILTHYPYDLLSYRNFSKLDLLESNTGKLKGRHQWSSKFYPVGDEDMTVLPFIEKLLLVFGDRVLIQPHVMKLRKMIIEIAQKRQWTAATSLDKVMMDLELEVKEPMVLQFLKKL